MRFEWDEAKNAANIVKHGVDFVDACRIFEGPRLTELDDRRDYGELRYRTFGLAGPVVILVVIHTPRAGVTRIISTRQANKMERERYEKAIR
jgi:hypothetical protein